MAGCGGSGGSSSSSSGGGGIPPATGNNVLAIIVNGPGLYNSYPNEPCVNVTIGTPGTTTCQTINDILLDTADIGRYPSTDEGLKTLREKTSGMDDWKGPTFPKKSQWTPGEDPMPTNHREITEIMPFYLSAWTES